MSLEDWIREGKAFGILPLSFNSSGSRTSSLSPYSGMNVPIIYLSSRDLLSDSIYISQGERGYTSLKV